MKIRILILILISSAILFINCTNDDESIQVETIDGVWNLKNISGGFAGVDVGYENGIVTWEFNSKTETLTVNSSLINNGPQSAYLPLISGEYSFSLSELNGKRYVHIKDYGIHINGEYGSYLIQDGILTINQSEGSESNVTDVFLLIFD